MKQRHRLMEILSTMDIPEGRRTESALADPHHLRWLNRNMFMRNSNHPQFAEATALLGALLKSENQKGFSSFN